MATLEDNSPAHRQGPRTNEGRLAYGRRRAHLAAPLLLYLIGIEPKVGGVVAQEASGVDIARQIGKIAVLERRQKLVSDLGVALDAEEVHALALARVTQPIPHR